MMIGTTVPQDDNTATRFSVLGPIRAWRGDRELAIGSPQQRTVLALLLLREGRLITIGELVDAVWDERPPRAAVTTIRTYLSRLRKVLGQTPQPDAPQLISIGGGYQLRIPPQALDLWHFQQHTTEAREAVQRGDHETAAAHLRSALDLDRGQPLAGASGSAIEAQRNRLTNLLSAAAEEQLSLEIARGRTAEVIPGLILLVERYPLRERLRELLMLALYRSGRQAEALAEFRRAGQLLSEELGIDPGPDLDRLHRQILAGDQELLPSGARSSSSSRRSRDVDVVSATRFRTPPSPRTSFGRGRRAGARRLRAGRS